MKKKLLVLFLFIGLFCLESVAGDCPPGCAPSSIIDNVCEGCGSAGAAIGAGLTVFTYCVAKCATNCFCDGEPVPGCGRCLKRTFGSCWRLVCGPPRVAGDGVATDGGGGRKEE